MSDSSRLKPFIHLGIVLCLTALFGIFTGIRMHERGRWLPDVPNEIGSWVGVDVPLESSTVGTLGRPKTLGRQYKNPFEETIDTHVIAAESFDAYTEPAMCMTGYGFTLTGQLFPEAFGKNNRARAMVLKHEDSGVRVLMLFWVQYEDGTTSGIGDLRGYADLSQRIKIGWNTVVSGKQCVIVRAYTRIAPNDTNNAQAKRNLYFVSRNLYEAIKRDGHVWKQKAEKFAKDDEQRKNHVS